MGLLRSAIRFSIPSVLLLATGCVTPGRLVDLSDCGRFSVGWGVGLMADVELGWLTHPSVGVRARTQRLGIDARDNCGRWDEMEYGSPFLQLMIPAHEAHPLWSYARDPGRPTDEAGFWLPPVTKGAREFHGVAPHWTFHNATDLSVGGTAGVLAVRLGINPLELVDFAFGYAGLDIGRDDPKPEEPTEKAAKQ